MNIAETSDGFAERVLKRSVVVRVGQKATTGVTTCMWRERTGGKRVMTCENEGGKQTSSIASRFYVYRKESV